MARPLTYNLLGQRFGMLVVIGRAVGSGVRWRCRCDCGNEISRQTRQILFGSPGLNGSKPARDCGCVILSERNLTGKRFGKLTVIERLSCKKADGSAIHWRCRCKCGRESIVRDQALRHKGQAACKCIHFRHGGAPRKGMGSLYTCWCRIRTKCFDSNHKDWDFYGGRGIRVCQRWRKSFAAFRDDVGEKPTSLHTLDRIDNDGHYSCGKCSECCRRGWGLNVQWATRREQSRNRRVCQRLTYQGRTQLLTDWARELGISASTICHRMKAYGWSAEKSLATPVKRAVIPASPRRKMRSNWGNMIHRCYSPKCQTFPSYGGRGITVCARWRESFANYLEDVGIRPSGKSLDRIDNDKGYWCGKPECVECGPLSREPNWRWATKKQQNNNRRCSA